MHEVHEVRVFVKQRSTSVKVDLVIVTFFVSSNEEG